MTPIISSSLGLMLALAPLVPAHAQIADEWQQTTLDRLDPPSPTCRSVWTSQRKLKFSPLPDGSFTGIFATAQQASWLVWQSPSCKLPYTYEARQGFWRLRTWSLLAVPSGTNRWKVGAQFQSCTFQGCDEPGLFKGSFEVTIELRGGRLVEVEGTNDHFVYRRIAEANALASEAEAAFKSAVGGLDAGNCVAFYTGNFEPGRIDTQQTAGLCRDYENIRHAMPAVSSTNIAFKAPLDAVMAMGRYIDVDAVLLYGFAMRADGSTTPRGAMLHQSAGRWLIKEAWVP